MLLVYELKLGDNYGMYYILKTETKPIKVEI